MANTITTRYRINGSKLFTAEVTILGDGSGEASAVEIVVPADLTGVPTDFKIRAVQWQFDGFSAELLWDATTDIRAFVLGPYASGLRFADTGAHLTNNAGSGKTGKLLLTTIGLIAGSKGSLIIEGQHT